MTIIICLWGSILMPLELDAVNYVDEIAKAKKENNLEKLGLLLAGRNSTYFNNGHGQF